MFLDNLKKFLEIAAIPIDKRMVVIDSSKVNSSNNYYLSISEHVVEIDTTDIGAQCDVFLPDVSQAAGMTFEIFSPDCGDGSTAQVFEADETTQIGNDFDANDDYVLVMSTGRHWRTLMNSSA